MMKNLPRWLVIASVPALLAGCVVEDDPSPGGDSDYAYGPPAAAGRGETSVPPTASGGGESPAPMLVVVDTDQTMTADPGAGVGVFVEYQSGGRWNVWWTCDTLESQQSCDFKVSATVASGNVSDVDASQLTGGYVSTPTPSRVEARVTTTNEVHGISFSTNPGAIITLEASVGGIEDGSFLFFVQNGQVNGGFEGHLTNPLQLQGSTP